MGHLKSAGSYKLLELTTEAVLREMSADTLQEAPDTTGTSTLHSLLVVCLGKLKTKTKYIPLSPSHVTTLLQFQCLRESFATQTAFKGHLIFI